jgi:lipopolysaccharide biosynthesis protein
MIGRLAHYLRRARTLKNEKGTAELLRVTRDFAIRRAFRENPLLESFEYHVLAPKRDVMKTLIRVAYQREDATSLSERWMVYASFDAKSEILPHVEQQLRSFHERGYRIVFVTTSPELRDEDVKERLAPWCGAVVHRKNEGYDFGSYKLGYMLFRGAIHVAPGAVESFILMNDSCLGPYGDLRAHIEKMIAAQDSVYGITKSYEIHEYIQSYFLHFGTVPIRSLLEEYMAHVRVIHMKTSIVRFMEIGLSHWMRTQKGIVLKAIVDPKNGDIYHLMNAAGTTDPVIQSVAEPMRNQGRLPLYKRSNLK